MTMSWNPFTSSTHGHPNFNPTKVYGKVFQFDAIKHSKQPKPPDKPLTPYMRFSKKIWDEIQVKYPELKIWQIGKIVGQKWRDLNETEKRKYAEEFELEKNVYNEALKQYHQSPAYQSWILSFKNKENEERDNHKRKDRKLNSQYNSPQKSEGRFSLQPLDSFDENDDYFSFKHLAAARYYRNNKLVNDIFSEVIVPDTRHNVSESRVNQLRNQTQQLEQHHQRLNFEIKELEEKFQQKKRNIIESSEQFYNELNKRFASNDLDQTLKDHYRKTFLKTIEQLKNEHDQNSPNSQDISSNEINGLDNKKIKHEVIESQPIGLLSLSEEENNLKNSKF